MSREIWAISTGEVSKVQFGQYLKHASSQGLIKIAKNKGFSPNGNARNNKYYR